MDKKIELPNVKTPAVGDVKGKLFISAGEGDCQITGDQVLLGDTQDSLEQISRANNPANNFFASQINNDKGILDTSGTFGSFNSNAQDAINISGSRQGWDITAVDISNKLPNI